MFASEAAAVEPAAEVAAGVSVELKVSHPGNLAMKQFDVGYYSGLATDEAKVGFMQCVGTGIENAGSGMGCYAMSARGARPPQAVLQQGARCDYHQVAEDATPST